MSELALSTIATPDFAVRLPGSRSLTNRALVCAALADGTSELSGWLDSDDTRAMREGLSRLGVAVEPGSSDLAVSGNGGSFAIPLRPLDCGASGTTMRFLTACAALTPGRVVLDGTDRMRERPIGELCDALRRLGVQAHCVAGYPPVTVQGGRLRGGSIRVDARVSSQFLSAILLVAPLADAEVEIEARDVTSRPFVDMTLEVMRDFGVQVDLGKDGRLRVPGRQCYRARRYSIEPDATSAGYFLAIAAVTGGRVQVDGLSPASHQPDVRFIELLERMGCAVERQTGAIAVRGPRYLHGIDADLNEMPDSALMLAVLACFAQGPTTIRNISNLRLKESDRIAALETELSKLGAEVETSEHDIRIRPPEKLRAARIATYDDHRMAMSFAVAGLRVPGVVIENPECVSKTFPGFFDRLAELAPSRQPA